MHIVFGIKNEHGGRLWSKQSWRFSNYTGIVPGIKQRRTREVRRRNTITRAKLALHKMMIKHDDHTQNGA